MNGDRAAYFGRLGLVILIIGSNLVVLPDLPMGLQWLYGTVIAVGASLVVIFGFNRR